MLSTDLYEFKPKIQNREFYFDIIHGLRETPKRLPSKYFYDKNGDNLFQAIMNSPDYYLTRCEMEIFVNQSQQIANRLTMEGVKFELIELGPGNCAKSIHLLKELYLTNSDFLYIPIDISENVINELSLSLPKIFPKLNLKGLIGDYFDALENHITLPKTRKIVMCLGANIGNMTPSEANVFCKKLRGYLQPGDQCIIGFDLIKNPSIIKNAYDDKEGLTKEFNLNLLKRINREFKSNFQINEFEHYCSYDPLTGAAKSYLTSLKSTVIKIGEIEIYMEKDEVIWTEISQKYSISQIHQLALDSGFYHTTELLDSKSWFMDAIWTAI